MNGSPVRVRAAASLGPAPGWGILAWGIFVWLASGPAAAQQAPIRLEPPKALPVQLAPAKQPEPAVEQSPVVEDLPAPEASPTTGLPPTVVIGTTGIQVDSLKSIDVDTVGVLTVEQGGFGQRMWEGTPRSLVDSILPQLPVNTASAAMRDLMRRLLLSTAAVPEGDSQTSLVVMRIGLLAAMGDTRGVGDLLKATPTRKQNRELTRIEADARFLANDNARACSLAAGQFGEGEDLYWNKAFIFCQALAGEMDKAALGLAVLNEMGEEDVVFTTLIEGLAGGGTVAVDSMTDPSPLHLAIARAAKVQLPADILSSNRPGILRAIAISPNAPVELRLEAAERAEAAGALPVDALRQLYASTNFTDEELANPRSRSVAESGPLSRALLYRNALLQTVPTARAEAMQSALELARQGGRYASTVRVYMDVLRQIPPAEELAWFAPEAIRALLTNKKHEQASVWFRLLKASALFNKDSVALLNALLPVARLAGSLDAETWTTGQLDAWWEAVKGEDRAADRAALLYSLFDALGEPVPDNLWQELIENSAKSMVAMLHPALWWRLQSAAEEGRVGEAVMLSLLALGEGGPGQAEPVVLRQVLTTLRILGLESEARELAVEAVMAVGL